MPAQILQHRILRHVDIAVLSLCLVVAVGVWWWGSLNDRSAEHNLAQKTALLQGELREYFGHVYEDLYAIKGFYENSIEVTDQEISRYVSTLASGRQEDYDPTLRYLFFARVPSEQVDDSEPGYVITTVLDYQGQLSASSGRDMSNLIHLVEHIEEGAERVMSRFAQVDEITQSRGDVLLFAVPVVKNDAIIGVIAGELLLEQLTTDIDQTLGGEVTWSWSSDGIEIAKSDADLGRRVLSHVLHIDTIASESWQFRVSVPVVISPIWNWFLATGVVMGFVVYGMVYAISLSGVRASEMAEVMTIDLQKYKQALDSSDNHVIITDADGVIIYANNASQRMTGFTFEEMRGQTPRLWGRQMEPVFYQHLWETIKHKRQVFTGELTNRRKDGTTYIAYATVSPIIDSSNQQLLGFVGIEYDITERKRTESELKRMNDLMIGRELKMAELKKALQEKDSKP